MNLFKTLLHPTKMWALAIQKIPQRASTRLMSNVVGSPSPEMKKCYYYMDMLSERYSFAIRSLDGELRDAVCVFYLVLRALDGVEDDVSISQQEKLRLLPEFHRFLENPSWNYRKGNDKNRILLEDFTTVSSQYRQLKLSFKAIISDVCARMGAGMAKHLNKAPETIYDWEEYCICVFGIFFIGVSRMLSEVEADSKKIGNDKSVSNSFGVFLQKVDIIQDYKEDMILGKQFWPREIWGKYCADFAELSHLKKTSEALGCLNEMVANTLTDIPEVLKFLERIQILPSFEFFAVHQVLAIAILERCYNNQQVFHGTVIIGTDEKAHLMMQAKNIDNVKAIFSSYLNKIHQRIPDKDPSAEVTQSAIKRALSSVQSPKFNTLERFIWHF